MVRKLLAAAPGSSPGRRSWAAARRGRRKGQRKGRRVGRGGVAAKEAGERESAGRADKEGAALRAASDMDVT